jgi:hypothetical protein
MKFTGVVLISGRDRGGGRKEGGHTESIHTDVVTGGAVKLRKFAAVEGAKIKEVLHTLPH